MNRLDIEAAARAAGPWTPADAAEADALRRLPELDPGQRDRLRVLRQRETTEAIRLRRGAPPVDPPHLTAAKIVARYGQTWEASFRILALRLGLDVRTVHHDPMYGWCVTLEDGREFEARSNAGVRAGLQRLHDEGSPS